MWHWLTAASALVLLTSCAGGQAMEERMARGYEGHKEASATVTPDMLKECEAKLNYKPLSLFADDTTWRMTEPLKPDPRLACLHGVLVGFTKTAYYAAKVELVTGSNRDGPTNFYWCSFTYEALGKTTKLSLHQVGLKTDGSGVNQARHCGLETTKDKPKFAF